MKPGLSCLSLWVWPWPGVLDGLGFDEVVWERNALVRQHPAKEWRLEWPRIFVASSCFSYVPGWIKLPLSPHNREWETQPNSRGFIYPFPYSRGPIKRWEVSHPQIKRDNLDHGSYAGSVWNASGKLKAGHTAFSAWQFFDWTPWNFGVYDPRTSCDAYARCVTLMVGGPKCGKYDVELTWKLQVRLVWKLSLTDFPFDAIDFGRRRIIEKVSCKGSLLEGVVFEGWSIHGDRLHFSWSILSQVSQATVCFGSLCAALGISTKTRRWDSGWEMDDWAIGSHLFWPLERYHLHWSFMSALEAPSCFPLFFSRVLRWGLALFFVSPRVGSWRNNW